MIRNILKTIILFLCIGFVSCATMSDTANYYREASYYAGKGNSTKVFMNLKVLLSIDSRSPYSAGAAFGVAEYYFDNNVYTDAVLSLRDYLRKYPNDKANVFAEVMLYKITKKTESEEETFFTEKYLLDSIRERIFSKPRFLFFGKRRRYAYRSVFDNEYIVFNYPEKMVVVCNGKIILELLP